jgi:predicted phage terminase large subunit-like protein
MSNLTRSLDRFEPSSLLALRQGLETAKLRRLAKTSLISFTEYTYSRYEAADIHRQIAEQLERVERGETDRLMLLVPPRHGKSELASRRFPAWYLGRHPERQFISASASVMLAEDFGRDVRNLIASQEYAQVFDTRLAEDSQAKGRWMTSEGGSYYACGVGSALMGRGAHIFLIDDPFGSMAEARSDIERKAVHSWYQGTVYNRLEKNGAIVLINHRMHHNDLSGRLLAQQAAGGDRWEVVELKAVSPSGEALWPEKFDAYALERIKRNTSAQDWSALYQQEPTPDEGSFFKEAWVRPVFELPEHMNYYGASDLAVTADGGDYTVHGVIGIDVKNRLFLVDLWRKQASSGEWVEAYCDLVLKWKPQFWAHERTSIISGVGPFLAQRAGERKAWTATEMFPTRGDKGVRCQSIRGRMELSGLYVPADASWLPDLKIELTQFPFGTHDDQCDMLGLAGQLLDKVWKAYVPLKDLEAKDFAFTGYRSSSDAPNNLSFMTM